MDQAVLLIAPDHVPDELGGSYAEVPKPEVGLTHITINQRWPAVT
ncbi:MAG: hypothetical protein ABIS86_22010 [Streptosporangiaceae bacterium]